MKFNMATLEEKTHKIKEDYHPSKVTLELVVIISRSEPILLIISLNFLTQLSLERDSIVAASEKGRSKRWLSLWSKCK